MFVPKLLVKPPDAVRAEEMAWLAGLLEGEGSFMVGPPSSPRRPTLQMSMTDRDVVARAASIIGCNVMTLRAREVHWQEAYGLRVRGAGAVNWMRALRPYLGERRTAQVDRALASYDPRPTSKLTAEDAAEALGRLRDGETVAQVAERFSVSIWCIYDLRLGRTHRDLKRPGR